MSMRTNDKKGKSKSDLAVPFHGHELCAVFPVAKREIWGLGQSGLSLVSLYQGVPLPFT